MHFEELYALGAIDGEAGDHVCLNGVKRYSKKNWLEDRFEMGS